MSTRIVEWSEVMRSLGDAVIAIGVFDGVHLGHQTLLRATVAEAVEHGTVAVAVTFDRDPDQVVAPETAAPQLLSLADKLEFISETGVDTVLVIPFTEEIAGMTAEVFLETILVAALRPVGLHVGRDFRFGARASGDLGALERFGMARGFSVVGHDLVEADGEPVTSTRIRRLVAAGDVVGAAALLGRPPRIVGTVRRGRGEGVKLGFPTANVAPHPYAALPGDGVYAGRVVFPENELWAAAISVGTPPTFPEARDYLEAHIIDFDGDLYDTEITLEFFERLRSQQAYGSLDELTGAISADVEQALEIAGFDTEDDDESEEEEAAPEEFDSEEEYDAYFEDHPVVEDPVALEAAEQLVRGIDPTGVFAKVDDDWVELLGPTVISGLTGSAGLNAFRITAPLDTVGIPFAWQPYPPEEMPAYRPAYGAVDRPFTLFVPAKFLAAARAVLSEAGFDHRPQDISELIPEGVETHSPLVDDPEALAAAEAAVAHRPADQLGQVDWDSWVPALAEQPYDRRRLLGLQYALQAAGVPVMWDPYSPAEIDLLKRAFFARDEFTLAVPNDRLDEAQAVIELYEASNDFEDE
jgi:riboflavin kinase / FMN adenylyltransferase